MRRGMRQKRGGEGGKETSLVEQRTKWSAWTEEVEGKNERNRWKERGKKGEKQQTSLTEQRAHTKGLRGRRGVNARKPGKTRPNHEA